MLESLEYTDLKNRRFSGTAWNVFYEYGLGDEWWGHSGEFADELDAWFLSADEAREFADQAYPDETLREMLLSAPDGDGAEKIMLSIEECEWEDGVDEFSGDCLFVTYAKDEFGDVVLEESYRK